MDILRNALDSAAAGEPAWLLVFVLGIGILFWILSWLFSLIPQKQPVGSGLADLPGLDEKMSYRLAQFGVHNDRDLIRLTPRGQQELESQLGLHNGEYASWREEVLRRWRGKFLPEPLRNIDAIYPDPELGALYSIRPRDVDILTQLPGVDATVASRINAVGIYTFDQLRHMTADQQESFKKKFSLPNFSFAAVDFVVANAGRLSAKAETAESITGTSKSEPDSQPEGTQSAMDHENVADTMCDANDDSIPRSRSHPIFGRVYSVAPPHRDDLTHLPGITSEVEAKLNEAGVYKMDQLRSLSSEKWQRAKVTLGLPDLNPGDWPNGIIPSDAAKSAGIAALSVAMTGHLKTASEAGETGASSNDQNSARERLDIGYVYQDPPPKTDDLTILAGVDGAKQQAMNDAGIYRFHQLRELTPRQQANLKSRFKLEKVNTNSWLVAMSIASAAGSNPDTVSQTKRPKLGNTPAHSSDDAKRVIGFASGASPDESENGETRFDLELGEVYRVPPSDRDDLTRLGIDAETALRLNQSGIYTFDQIDAMSPAQQRHLADKFGLENADFGEWKRCIYAWSRGVETELAAPVAVRGIGWLHGIRLPEILPGVFDGKQLVAYPEQVIFRGSDPASWGKSVEQAVDGVDRSVQANDVRNDINYVRIRRLDTRESVVTAVSKSQVFAGGPDDPGGWNGLCDEFFGGRHLGIFSCELPNEMETKFGIGGWGFGHRFDHNDSQECGWAGRLIPPTSFEISVGRIGGVPGTVVFRSADPSIWNKRVRGGGNHTSTPLSDVKHPIAYIRIQRTDTGDAVIVRVDGDLALGRTEQSLVGWNGTNEHFSGAYHLGAFHRQSPQGVEVCFGEGGWGFGHPYGLERQACGWGGEEIGETVFEISVLEHLPDHLGQELME